MGDILGQSSQLQLHLMDTTTTRVCYWVLAKIVGTCIVNFHLHGEFWVMVNHIIVGFPWPLGTNPISLMVAVELGQCVSCLVQLGILVQWVTLSAEWVPYCPAHTEGLVVVQLTVALRQDIALAQSLVCRHLVLA